MKEVVLKFGEHLVSLQTAEQLHVIVENNNTNQTNIIVEPTINDEDVTYNFDNDDVNINKTLDNQESDDDRAYVSSLLNNRDNKDILIPYESDKSIYQEIEESANEVSIYPSDDFKLTQEQDDDFIVNDNDTSDSQSESFVPSIESHIDTEEQFLNKESNKKGVATAKKEFEEPNYDDESESMIQDDEVTNSQNENNQSDSLIQDDESENENTNDKPMIQDDESEVSTMNIQNNVDDSKILQDDNVDNNDFLNDTKLTDEDDDENE